MEVNIKYTIQKSVEEVFDAIVNPNKISGYFTSGVQGEFVEGNKIIWEFADFGVNLQVEILEIKQSQKISFRWDASGQSAIVNFHLTKESEASAQIEITEGEFENDEAGLQKLIQQTIGWTDFVCSLKAYLYTGVNLRNGKFNKK